jgi:hypothetical protein
VPNSLLMPLFSKKWIVDRATVHQARYEDLQYVEDPEYLDYLAIYFANCSCHSFFMEVQRLTMRGSNYETRKEAPVPAEGNSNSYGVLPPFLSQELVQ